jgi:hypothetical protein
LKERRKAVFLVDWFDTMHQAETLRSFPFPQSIASHRLRRITLSRCTLLRHWITWPSGPVHERSPDSPCYSFHTCIFRGCWLGSLPVSPSWSLHCLPDGLPCPENVSHVSGTFAKGRHLVVWEVLEERRRVWRVRGVGEKCTVQMGHPWEGPLIGQIASALKSSMEVDPSERFERPSSLFLPLSSQLDFH